MKDFVGWPFQSSNLQVDWKVHDQTHWETERVVGSVDGNHVNGSESPVLQDFLHSYSAGTQEHL